MKVARLFRSLLVLIPLLLAGCATYERASVEKRLEMQLKRYEQIARWGDMRQLWGFLKPELREQEPVPTDLPAIRVTYLDSAGGALYQDEHHALYQIMIEYVHTDHQVVRRLVDEQQWEYDAALETWFRSNPIPAFD